MAILKRFKGQSRLKAAAARDIDAWFADDLRDFLACIVAGAHGANERTYIEAAEALAYLNWRENRRMTDLNGGRPPSRPLGGQRCTVDRFQPDDPMGHPEDARLRRRAREEA